MDEGQRWADGAVGHGSIDGFVRGDKGVRRAVVAIDAIHHAALALGLRSVEGRGGIGGDGPSGLVRCTQGIVVRVGSVAMYSMWPRCTP